MNSKECIELKIIEYIADSDTPKVDINRLINFVLDLREAYIKNNHAVPVKDVAFGRMADDGGDHVVYSMEAGKS